MNSQVLSSMSEFQRGGTTQMVKPVTLDSINSASHPSDSSSRWFPITGFDAEDTGSIKLQQQGKIKAQQVQGNSQQLEKISKQADIHDSYEEHRQFLQKYKQQRGEQIKIIRERYYLNSSFAEQENESGSESSEESVEQIIGLYRSIIKQRMNKIHSKIQKQILSQRGDPELLKYKVFTDVVTSKNDLERMSKEKRFIRSQQQKHVEYEQPNMPAKNKLPLQYRVNTQSFDNQSELCRKAKEFISRVHKQQQNLLGKHILRKKKEESRRLMQLQQEMRRSNEMNDMKKEERRMKAQQNLLLMQEKAKINSIINRNSINQLRKILTDKQHKLQAMRSGLKESQQRYLQSSLKKMPNKPRDRVKTEVTSDHLKYEEFDSRLRKLKVSNDKLGKLKEKGREKEGSIRARLKIGIKKHKFSKPTEYRQNTQYMDERQNQFLNKQINLSPKKSSRSADFEKEDSLARQQYQKKDTVEENRPALDKQKEQFCQIERSYTQYAKMQEDKIQLSSQRQQTKQKRKVLPNSALQ